MIYIAPPSGRIRWHLWLVPKGGKSCLKAVSDLQSRTEGGKVFQIPEAETWKARELKLRLWHGTGSNKVAEERMDLLSLW